MVPETTITISRHGYRRATPNARRFAKRTTGAEAKARSKACKSVLLTNFMVIAEMRDVIENIQHSCGVSGALAIVVGAL